MAQIFNIEDNKVVISDVEYLRSHGNVNHTGDFEIAGDLLIQNNLTVNGEITVETLNVKKLNTPSGLQSSESSWTTINEADLNGKGFHWTWGEGSLQLIYRHENRLWTNGNIDLSSESSYKIDNVAVLSANSLGNTVTKSNLRQVGPLNSLTVTGNASISEFAFFSSITNRLGLGTDSPSASITILDNNVEISIGSPSVNVAHIGTSSNHDVAIISDDLPRLIIKNNGEVHIGDENSKSGVLRIFGSLYADNVISDTRIERTSPIEFKATRDTSIFGNGLIWTGTGNTRQLIMKADPDRLWTGESFDIGPDQAYYVNGSAVLNEISLGKTVLYSNLITLGNLESLQVNGSATVLEDLTVSGLINGQHLIFNNGLNKVELTPGSISCGKSVSILAQGLESFYADDQEIVIGHKQLTRRPVKVFGPLTVGVNNPDPTLSLAVNGPISFANKTFIVGFNAPTEGNFNKGDICWNQAPQEDGYVGWICIIEGSPGMWAPFGAIGRHG